MLRQLLPDNLRSVSTETALESRRLFKIDGTITGFLVAHFTAAGHFHLSGAVPVPITEYGVSFP